MVVAAIAEGTDGALVVTLLAVVAAASVAAAALAAALLARAKRIEARLERLAVLDDLRAQVEKLGTGSEELDLRRIEHVLIDLRDGQKRTEERLLALIEARIARERETNAIAEPTAGALAERVVGRLLSLGYERIQLVTPNDDLARIARHGGEVVVEARRDGAACKGKVLVRAGSIHDVQLQSAYGMFP